MSKPGKVLRNLCKKLGVRLTVKRGKKRVYKSVAVLKRQCKNKKKKKKIVKRKRRFGMAPPYMSYQTVDNEGTYIGERKNGKKHGRGKMTYSSGSVYIGNWKNDKKEGQGRMDYSSGSNYVGEWKNGLMDGKGRMNSRFGIYEGEWKEGDKHGKGKMEYRSGRVYEGEWKEGFKHGKGKMKYRNGSVYDGQWEEGEKHGKGKMEYNDGDIYDGEWREGEKHGYGESVEYWEEDTYGEDNEKKLVYKGEHKYGYKNGKGVGMYYNFDFEWIKYEGDWIDDVKEGRGIMTWSSGRQYTGEFKNHKKHGRGTEYNFVGKGFNLLYKGKWEKDNLVDGDYHLYQDGVYEYTKHVNSNKPDGYKRIVKTVEDEDTDLKGLQEFKKVRANFLREGFGKRRKKKKRKK